MLQGKTVLLGVTGGIACFKAAALASMLKKQHADVQVVMTENATKFVTPLTFEQLTGNRALVDTFDRNFRYDVGHIALADRSTITTKEDCVAVELPKGSTRDALNLVDHPELRGQRVYVKGNLVESYFGTTGLKGTSEYKLP